MKKIEERFTIKDSNHEFYTGDNRDSIPQFGEYKNAKEFKTYRQAETEIYDSFVHHEETGREFVINKKYVVVYER